MSVKKLYDLLHILSFLLLVSYHLSRAASATHIGSDYWRISVDSSSSSHRPYAERHLMPNTRAQE